MNGKTPAEQLLEEAQALVMGVVTARRAGSEAHAGLLIASYMEDAERLGLNKDMAWAMLFSAATRWVDALVEHQAHHEQRPVHVVISALAAHLVSSRG